ncbi:hypothetical protein BD410DRAFT_639513 [Rickenella mellea]|uniref:Uncharacterized protein n=1 Tax=Rickenella mellea TaxID=50990 RepID=A0A4Y7QCN4_9AGAM|nr:hypothetical protein BD410DRAFT_639513 [Rickenella mellea]
MPHKRAKRSVRELQRSQRKTDLPPAASTFTDHTVPKSAARVLNAEALQAAFREKKRKAQPGNEAGEDGGARRKRKRRVDAKHQDQSQRSSANTVLKILPGESLGHFNKRVEDDMRPVVRSAIRGAKSTPLLAKTSVTNITESKRKSITDPDINAPVYAESKPARTSKTDFDKLLSSAPKRLNDIAQAPPTFKSLPRGAKQASQNAKKDGERSKSDVISMAQKAMMEVEREKAIERYRAMKEAKMVQRQEMG